MFSLQLILEELKPDIVVISETKATASWVASMFKEWGYEPAVKVGVTVNSGGMVIAVRPHMGAPIDTTASKHQNIFSVQLQWSGLLVRMIAAYGLQETESNEERQKFFTELEVEIESSIDAGCIPVVVGDLNAKYEFKSPARIPLSPNGQLLCDVLNKFSLHAANDLPQCDGKWTRQHRNNPDEKSVLDYIIFPSLFSEKVVKVDIDEDLLYTPFTTTRKKGGVVKTFTDHNSIILEVQGTQQMKPRSKQVGSLKGKWKLTKEGLEKFHDATNDGFFFKHDDESVQEIYNKVVDEMEILMKSCFKQATWKERYDNERGYTSKVMKKTLALLKRMKKEGKIQRKIAKYYHDFIQEQKGVMVHRLKAEKIKETLKNLTEDDVHFSRNAFWKLKKKCGHSVSNRTSVLTSNGVEVFSDSAIIEEYEKEFVNRLLPRQIDPLLAEYQKTTNNLESLLTQHSKILMEEPDFVLSETQEAKSTLKRGKSPGMDLFPPEIFICGGIDMDIMVTKLANLMKNTLSVPHQFFNTLITTIHKKGSVKVLRNKRGIFLCVVISKIIEKLIKQRIEDHIQRVNILQAGSRSKRGCPDNLFLLRGVMDHAKYTGKTIYLTSYDFTQCFDSLWLEDCIISLWNLGVSRQLLAMIKKMNESVNIVVNTPHGRTKQRSLSCIVKQGSVLGPTLCSSSTAELADESRYGVNTGKINVPCAIFVDDILNLNTNSTNTIRSHDDTLFFSKKKRLGLSYDKCLLMVANKKPKEVVPTLEIKKHAMSHVRCIKVLGDMINDRSTNTDLIADRVKRGKGVVVSSFSLCSELSLGCFSLEIQAVLYESVFLQTVIFNSQSWTKLTKTDCKNLQCVQLKYLKRMMQAPNATPNVSLFLELGVLPIVQEIHVRKLVFLHHILNLEDDDPEKGMYCEQLELPFEANWGNEVKHLKDMYGITIRDEEIEKLTIDAWRNMVKTKVSDVTFNRLKNLASEGHKTCQIVYETFGRQKYVNHLLPRDARLIFRLRSRTVSCKDNHKSSYPNLQCRLCRSELETQAHVVNCPVVRGGDGELDVERVYGMDFVEERTLIDGIVRRLLKFEDLLENAN